MTITVSKTYVAEAGHWYTRDGLPRYTVIGSNGKERPTTLRDARKDNLVPSVTTIINVAANPVLNQWIQKQVLMAALTLPKVEGEADEDYVSRIMADSKQQGKDAADKGTEIHNAIQSFYEGVATNAYAEHVQGCVFKLHAEYGNQPWIAERSFGHDMGFGGKCDLYSTSGDGLVVDIKTKDFADGDKIEGYDSHLMQLAAYRVGLGIPSARCSNIFVSRTSPGLAVIKEWSEEELMRGWEMFYSLLRFYQIKNKIQQMARTTYFDLTGQVFGRLRITERFSTSEDGAVLWKCKCECGSEKIVRASNLRNRTTTSCGCLRKESVSKRRKTHGLTNTRPYRIWSSMITRCNNEKASNYYAYGGRGIKVCDDWLLFENFFKDMGMPNENQSIDRINVDGNYDPANCKWATKKEQAKNKRKVKVLNKDSFFIFLGSQKYLSEEHKKLLVTNLFENKYEQETLC